MSKLALPKVDFKAIADDFRNLNPQDVGTWPVLPRVAVLLALFIAVLVAGWWFLWNPQWEELAEKQREEETLRNDWVAKKKQAVNLDLYQAQKTEIDRVFGALLKQLPNRTEIEALLVEINQSGLGRGLRFELFKPGSEANKDFYAELPISVRLTGTYHDLGAFAADIARLSRIVTLHNINLTPLQDGKLGMDAMTLTYRALDDEEISSQKKAARGKKR